MSTQCICEKCGNGFELTEAEEERKSRGIEPPGLCPVCREENRKRVIKANSAKNKRETIKTIAYLLGLILFLVLIAVIYGAINHNNPYSPVGKDMSSAVTTSGAGQTG